MQKIKVTAKFLFLIFLIGMSNCVRFKIDNLKPTLVSKIKIGTDIAEVEGVVVNNALLNIPLRIPINANRLYITDYNSSYIKVYGGDGDLDFILGNVPSNYNLKVKVSNQKFGKLGLLAVSSDDDLYIQNRISTGVVAQEQTKENSFSKNTGYFDTKEKESIASYLLHIDSKGKMESIIGVTGKNSEPFRYIESLYAYDKNRLAVYHKFAEQMQLNYYTNGDLVGSIKEGNLNIFSSNEANEYTIKLDTMIPHKDGEFALVSFSYIGKKDFRFKFRRIYKYAFGSNEPESLLKEFQYPSEILFAVNANKEFLIWETENKGESVKLQVHDKDGNHINNKRLQFPPPRLNWRETYMDENDNLYSIKTSSGYLELYSWN
ncbi:MAG: hypothetical protein KBA66_07010 [Leptospiraceae bacterium]|nr:hypothetical protein [Leptospiraceae bacterium]